jgi:hypothetical protein
MVEIDVQEPFKLSCILLETGRDRRARRRGSAVRIRRALTIAAAKRLRLHGPRKSDGAPSPVAGRNGTVPAGCWHDAPSPRPEAGSWLLERGWAMPYRDCKPRDLPRPLEPRLAKSGCGPARSSCRARGANSTGDLRRVAVAASHSSVEPRCVSLAAWNRFACALP